MAEYPDNQKMERYLNELLSERDRRYEERFNAQKDALRLALEAQRAHTYSIVAILAVAATLGAAFLRHV